MDFRLDGVHAVITGAGGGIGAAISRILAARGARVTLMGRTKTSLERTAAGLAEARVVPVDVTDDAAVTAAFADASAGLGPVQILINNAGAAASAPLARTDNALWRRLLAVNLSGVFFSTRAVLPDLRQAAWGRIITIASSAGIRGYGYVAAYCAAKHGAVGLTRALALELAATGITVNAVCPGYTETDMLETALQNIMDKTGMDRQSAVQTLQAENPQGRFVQPREVAATVDWLCSPDSGAITGQAIAVTGGEVMP